MADATMRKRLKKKRRSCALCKPNKTGGTVRWKPKELALLQEFERGEKFYRAGKW